MASTFNACYIEQEYKLSSTFLKVSEFNFCYKRFSLNTVTSKLNLGLTNTSPVR
jgi:hypothetical protein